MLIKIRRGFSSEWQSANPVLALGEQGLDVDLMRVKVGDGVTPWLSLPFIDKRKIQGVGMDFVSVASGVVAPVQHGLGRAPDFIEWYFECWQAINGYAVGNRLYSVQTGQPNIYADAVGIYVTLPAATTLLRKGTSTSETLNRSRWSLTVKPFIYD